MWLEIGLAGKCSHTKFLHNLKNVEFFTQFTTGAVVKEILTLALSSAAETALFVKFFDEPVALIAVFEDFAGLNLLLNFLLLLFFRA